MSNVGWEKTKLIPSTRDNQDTVRRTVSEEIRSLQFFEALAMKGSLRILSGLNFQIENTAILETSVYDFTEYKNLNPTNVIGE